MVRKTLRAGAAVVGLLTIAVTANAVSAPTPADEQLKSRVMQATKSLCDLKMVATVVYKNKKAMEKVDSNYVRLYDFKTANLMYKHPGKIRMDGKLGMVKFEYIINGGMKIFRAPALKITRKEDYADDPAKLQHAIDIGLIVPSLWEERKVEVVNDAAARDNKEILLKLRWRKGDMVHYAWLDSERLWLKRLEKRDKADKLCVRMDYSNPVNVGGIVWVPTKIDMYSADGERAGTTEIGEIRVNAGLPDSLFE